MGLGPCIFNNPGHSSHLGISTTSVPDNLSFEINDPELTLKTLNS